MSNECETTCLVCLVAKEMDLLKFLICDASKRIRLVPSMREDVEGYLAADGIGEAIVREIILERLDEAGSTAVFL